MSLMVQTVLGAISPEALGVTLSHEHFLFDQRQITYREPADPADRELATRPVSLELFHWLQLNWGSNLDNLILDSEELAIEEAQRFRRAGGQALVELTLEGAGRDPAMLARIARATDLHVIMGSGYYVGPTHPKRIASMHEQAIAEEIIAEFRRGVGETRIRPGVIGEIGSSWPMTPDEAKVFRGAGLAQAALQCGLTVHPGRHPDSPFEILDILETSGADLTRVIIGHIERTVQDPTRLGALADTGCYIEYDLFGTEVTARYPYRELGITIPSDAQRLDQIRVLMDSGHAAQLLFSHDVCTKHRTRRYGGAGYDHILRDILPWMHQRGFTDREIRQPVVDNPRRAFALPTLL